MKLRTIKLILASFFILSCIGCASTRKDFIALPEQAKMQIASSDFALIKDKAKLHADINNSNISAYSGGGLIFGLIDASIDEGRIKDSEKLLAPIKTQLASSNSYVLLKKKLTPVLNKAQWLKMKNFRIVKENPKENHKIAMNNLLSKSKSAVFGVLRPNYTLESDFSALKTLLTLDVYPLSPDLKQYIESSKDKLEPIYRTKVAYYRKLNSATNDANSNAKLWAADNGKEIKVALEQSMDELARLLAIELDNTSEKIK